MTPEGNDKTVIVTTDSRPGWQLFIALISATAIIVAAILTVILSDKELRCQYLGISCPGPTPPPTPPPDERLEISVYSSDTKDDWLDAVDEALQRCGDRDGPRATRLASSSNMSSRVARRMKSLPA